MFGGARDEFDMVPPRRTNAALIVMGALGAVAWVLVVLVVLLIMGVFSVVHAGPRNCSQTVGTSPAAVSFGNQPPSQYVMLCNAHGTNTLGVNPLGGTAAIGSAGTLSLTPTMCFSISRTATPLSLSVVGSGAGTTTACGFQ